VGKEFCNLKYIPWPSGVSGKDVKSIRTLSMHKSAGFKGHAYYTRVVKKY